MPRRLHTEPMTRKSVVLSNRTWDRIEVQRGEDRLRTEIAAVRRLLEEALDARERRAGKGRRAVAQAPCRGLGIEDAP